MLTFGKLTIAKPQLVIPSEVGPNGEFEPVYRSTLRLYQPVEPAGKSKPPQSRDDGDLDLITLDNVAVGRSPSIGELSRENRYRRNRVQNRIA